MDTQDMVTQPNSITPKLANCDTSCLPASDLTQLVNLDPDSDLDLIMLSLSTCLTGTISVPHTTRWMIEEGHLEGLL